MSLFVNGVEISEVFVDGIPADTVFANGVEVYSGLAPIDPVDIPTLYSALRSDVGIVLDVGVQQWNQIPGAGSTPVNGAALFGSNQPTYIVNDPNFNNWPSLLWDSTSKRQLGNILPNDPFPFTFAFVYKWNVNGSSAQKMLGEGAISGGGQGGIQFYQNAGVMVCRGVSLTFLADTLPHILICEVQNGQTRAWRDGVDSGILAPIGLTSWVAFEMGNQTQQASGMNGNQAAWSQYNAILTDKERNGIGLFYADQYGLTWNP